MPGPRSGAIRAVRLQYGDRCKRCAASIIWTLTTNDKRLPVDALPHVDGTIQITFHDDGSAPRSEVLTGMLRDTAEYGSLYVAHFATCTSNQPKEHHP